MSDPNCSESDGDDATDPHPSIPNEEGQAFTEAMPDDDVLSGDENHGGAGQLSSPEEEALHEDVIEVEVGWLEDEHVVRKPCPQPEMPPLRNPRRATPSPEVRRLPRQTSSASIASSTATGSDDVCCICLEKYNDTNPGSAGACGHVFHFVCLLEWQQRNNTCPLCLVPMAMVAEDTRPRPAAVAEMKKKERKEERRRRRQERRRASSRDPSTAASRRSSTVETTSVVEEEAPEPPRHRETSDNDAYLMRQRRQREEEERSEAAPKSWWKRMCTCCAKK